MKNAKNVEIAKTVPRIAMKTMKNKFYTKAVNHLREQQLSNLRLNHPIKPTKKTTSKILATQMPTWFLFRPTTTAIMNMIASKLLIKERKSRYRIRKTMRK
jgi:hypothetical protein